MIMPQGLRRFALLLHVTCSVGSLGAVATFLLLAIVGLTSREAFVTAATYPAMALTTTYVIVPLLFAALLTGLVSSLGTSWGLLRHYWVVMKLFVTMIVIVVLLLQLDPIGYLAATAAEGRLSGEALVEARIALVVHSGLGLLVLLVAQVLSIYKPRGMTSYGWRKLREQPVPPTPPQMPG